MLPYLITVARTTIWFITVSQPVHCLFINFIDWEAIPHVSTVNNVIKLVWYP